jgi:GT2 family glycosyltransferase
LNVDLIKSTVFIVIVNYTKYKDTIECLESILKSSYEHFQIIIVDNSPNDESHLHITNWLKGVVDTLSTEFPDLVYPLVNKPISYQQATEGDVENIQDFDTQILLVKAKNRGFAAANNIALKYILKQDKQNSFTWILNNDTVIEKNCLKNLVDSYENTTDKFMTASKLRFYYHKDQLQAVAGKYNKWLGSTTHIGGHQTDLGQYDNFLFSDDNYIIGASMFLPLSFIKTVGLMEEDYFLYYEELDWTIRAKENGFKCKLQANAVVYHKEGSSIINNDLSKKKDTSLAEYYSIVNRVRFTKNWHKLCLPTVLAGVVFALIKRLFKGKIKLAKKVSIDLWHILLTSKAV